MLVLAWLVSWQSRTAACYKLGYHARGDMVWMLGCSFELVCVRRLSLHKAGLVPGLGLPCTGAVKDTIVWADELVPSDLIKPA